MNALPQSAAMVLRAQGIGTRFGTQQVHHALTLTLPHRQILGVVGGSGTGKSVLLRTLVGLRRPQAGRVELLGHDLYALDDTRQRPLLRRIGVLFQDGALFSSLSVLENIIVPLREHTALTRRDAARVATLKMALAGLPQNARHKYPSELSGGMRKRAALARALALDAEILFLDEPTSGLDPVSAAGFDALLRTLRDALGLSVYMNTHDLDSLHASCDAVAVLAEQHVLIQGELATVARYDHPWIQAYFHGPRGRAAAACYQTASED